MVFHKLVTLKPVTLLINIVVLTTIGLHDISYQLLSDIKVFQGFFSISLVCFYPCYPTLKNSNRCMRTFIHKICG